MPPQKTRIIANEETTAPKQDEDQIRETGRDHRANGQK